MEKYLLILEKRQGDFMPIDISLLEKNFNSLNDIKLIDNYTKGYTKEELINNIKKANIVTEDYLKGELFILEECKNKYPIISKNTFDFELVEFIYFNSNNKNVMNTIYNIYCKNVKNILQINVNEFKTAIENKDVAKIILLLQMLPYLKLRCIKFYIQEKFKKNN